MNERVKRILTELEIVRENLLAFSDDIWLNIDHRNASQLARGVEFIQAYNEKVATFDSLAADISSMIQQFTDVHVEEQLSATSTDAARNERIIKELDRATPHTVEEDFSYKRPYGFALKGRAVKDVFTWRRLYQIFCEQLQAADPGRFSGLPDDPRYISNRGFKSFSRNRRDLRYPLLVAPGIYAEGNLSANHVCGNMKR